ncbi:unnamed protein product [Allacma fusca]|uniref:Cilia- and flagella-associated protein 45 n=1 Tax=Allacma fusca TaxID=39272 RepID=A0A8J2LHS6_9HEXA|nr:unnamed protein product [Allacma fusca]
MTFNPRIAGKYHVLDKCKPVCDMGMSIQFADAIPGMNDTAVRPFGWSEYESAFRHQYITKPGPKIKSCTDPCKPRGTTRKQAPRQFFDPCCTAPRNNICALCQQAKCRCKIPPPWQECKEKLVVYDPDSIRNLIVHGELKNEHPIVLSNCDYSKLLQKAIVKTKEEKEAECLAAIQQKQEEIERCRQTADEMRMMDKVNFNASISPEAREAMDEILGRANTITMEEEPEVRALNQVILAAKVQAIREAQLAEKHLIKCEQAEEEKRLLAMIAQTSNPLLGDDVKDLEELQKKKKELFESLRGQLDEKEAMKYLDKLAVEHERHEMRKVWEMQDMEDIVIKNATLERKHKLGKELLDDQLLQLEKKKMEKALDRQEDEQMLEWIAKKQAEQERVEKEKKEKKKLKEMLSSQLSNVQVKTEQSKAMREELRTKRYQEKQEREWRNREKQDILKKKKAASELKDSILGQICQRQECAFEEAAYDKAMYDKIFSIQNAKFDEDKKKVEEAKVKNAKYKLDLREQIHKIQLGKIQERKDFFVEGINFRRELGRREKDIRQAMENKLEELRASNLPEKYLNYVRKAMEEQLKPDWQKNVEFLGVQVRQYRIL